MRFRLLSSIWLWTVTVTGQDIPTVFRHEDGVLQPPDWNLAKSGATITASTTCGQEKTADYYCKIFFNDCNYCLASSPNVTRRHPIENVIDGTESYWMSPPLSRGQDNQRVNIVIDLHQPFHVAYVTIKYAISPRAKTWVLERSVDGETWLPWQYFARDVNGCAQFGLELTRGAEFQQDSSVICTNEHTELVPATDGEVIVSLINGRPSQDMFSRSEELQEFTRASKIRIRLLELNTLYGHLMSPDLSQEVMKRYFYAIKNIEIGGRCVCNGHAETCIEQDGEFHCQCEHNTTGRNCDQCKPNFVQKKWKPGVPGNNNTCEACNCHGHSDKCVYDEDVAERRASLDVSGNYEGGGVCQKCGGNTEGNNCERCQAGFFRDHNAPKTEPCMPCNCNPDHSNGKCDPRTGQCECEKNFGGLQCAACAPKLFYYPKCDREFQCDECTHDLMETILPETDKIKKSVEDLHNVKAHKLAFKRYEKIDAERDEIEHSILLIDAGIDLSLHIDDRLDEVRKDICGNQGEAARWDKIINSFREDVQNAKKDAEDTKMEAEAQRGRAETVVRDFEFVDKMSDEEYEGRMVPARHSVDTLQEIYQKNEYKPLLAMAEAEREKSVALLDEVKERFGGGESTGRCHGDREPKDFSKHRLQPANKENFNFVPGDIGRIDSEGNVIPIDNSHIYDEGYDPYEQYEYEDEEEDSSFQPAFNPPLVDPADNVEEEETFDEDDQLQYEITDVVSNNAYAGQDPCTLIGKQAAVIPNEDEKHVVENLLDLSGEEEAYVGLKANVGVPPNAWRWEPKLWRKFNYRNGWAEESNDPNKRCAVMTKEGWKTEVCEELLSSYICLGRDVSATDYNQRGKYRYFIQHGEPVNYYGAAQACAELGYLLAVVPTEKTHQILIQVFAERVGSKHNDNVLANYVAEQKVQRAWIGLRAEGAESEVNWTWSNGRVLKNELLDTSEMRQANSEAANEQKQCMVVKRHNGRIVWRADSCQPSRPFVCSNNPPSDMFRAPLSRGKRNLHVLIQDLQRTKRDPLETLNEQQDSPAHHPKDAQFAPLDTLVQDVISQEYPPTSSLADQLECVVMIEDKASSTSEKLVDLETKIQDSLSITSDVNEQLDQMNEELRHVQDGITAVESITSDVETARDLVDEAEELADDALEYMDELEQINPEDMQLDELDVRVEEYKSEDWEHIDSEVQKARKYRKALEDKLLELLEAFVVAHQHCEIHDNDFVECEISALTEMTPLIQGAWADVNDANEKLIESERKMHDASDLKKNYVGCEDLKSVTPQDITSMKNAVEQLKGNLANITMENYGEYRPTWNEDIAFINEQYAKVIDTYDEIYGMLYGKTPEPPEEQHDKDVWGVEGGMRFLRNPGCWNLDPEEECDFNTEISDSASNEDSDAYISKYEEIVETALEDAERMMNGRGENVQLKMDAINRDFEDLTIDQGDPDVVRNTLNDIEGTINDIKHLIESTRSLLDRVPLEHNAQGFNKSDYVEPHVTVGGFGDSRYHFEVDMNVRLKAKNNNLLYFGNAENFVTIDTANGVPSATYTSGGVPYSVQASDALPVNSAEWWSIHFEKMGRRIEISAKCAEENTCSSTSAPAERTDAEGGRRRRRKRRRRHRKSSKRSIRFPRDVSDSASEAGGAALFLPLGAAKWAQFESVCTDHQECAENPAALRAIVGDYYHVTNELHSENFEGLKGDLNGLRVNGHLVTPWQFNSKSPPDDKWDKVDKPLEERGECWSDKSQSFEKDGRFSAMYDCPCLDGRNSYVKIDPTGIDLTFRDKLHAIMQFSPFGSQSGNYIVAAMFTEKSYILVEKTVSGFELIIKGPEEEEEIISKCNYFPPQENNPITLKFGIITSSVENHREAGILQFTDLYRPHLEEIPNDENQGHRVRMEEESWKQLGFDLEGQPLFIGGIPKHLLTKLMRKVLTDRKLIETNGGEKFDFDIKSMGACFRRINVNWDDKNRKNENRFLGVIDGRGIYRHNKIPRKKDINIVPGRDLESKDTVFQPIKLVGRKTEAESKELSFGIMFHAPNTPQKIVKFDKDELEIDEDGFLSGTIGGERKTLNAKISSNAKLQLIVVQTTADGTSVTVLGDDVALVNATMHFSATATFERLTIGGDPFVGKILQPRIQTAAESFDLLNGEYRKDRPDKDRFACLTPGADKYNCNNMQYNTYYTFN